MNACVLNVTFLGPFLTNEIGPLPALHLCCFCPYHLNPGTFIPQNSENVYPFSAGLEKEKGGRVLCPSRPGLFTVPGKRKRKLKKQSGGPIGQRNKSREGESQINGAAGRLGHFRALWKERLGVSSGPSARKGNFETWCTGF